MKINYIIIPLVAVATAVIGSFFTSSGMEWYKTIAKPTWTPPGSVIGTVWTILFTLSALSALIVWNSSSPNRGQYITAIIVAFIINIILNILWSAVFFGAHWIGLAVIEAGLLGLSVLTLVVLIWPVSALAAILLVPYFLWVSFATYLTYSVWILNK